MAGEGRHEVGIDGKHESSPEADTRSIRPCTGHPARPSRDGNPEHRFVTSAQRTPLVLVGAICVLIVLALIALGSGRYPIGPAEMASVIWKRLSGVGEAGTADAVVWQIRMPRVAVAALVGAALAAALQSFGSGCAGLGQTRPIIRSFGWWRRQEAPVPGRAFSPVDRRVVPA